MVNIENYFMDAKTKNEITDIMKQSKCSKGFRCVLSGFETLCKAEHNERNNLFKCLETEPSDCSFAVLYGDGYLCNCQLRLYLARAINE